MMPVYYDLLYEAQQASQRVDLYDLHGEDQKSVATWQVLVQASLDAQTKLIEYVRDHAAELLAHLTTVS